MKRAHRDRRIFPPAHRSTKAGAACRILTQCLHLRGRLYTIRLYNFPVIPMVLLRVIGLLLLVGLLVFPSMATADSGSFGPSVRSPDTSDDDRARQDAAHRGARQGIAQLRTLGRQAAQRGEHDAAIDHYEAVLSNRWTPQSMAIAIAVDKTIVEIKAGRIDDAIETIHRADVAAHDAESIPLWRTVRYLRTALLAATDELSRALQFFDCDAPEEPTAQLLCDTGGDIEFDADAFIEKLTTIGVYYPTPTDGREAYGPRLVAEPLLFAIHANDTSPRRLLFEDPSATLSNRLQESFETLLEIYELRDDPTSQLRVHLTLADLPVEISRATTHLERAEHLYGQLEDSAVADQDIAFSRAHICLWSNAPDDCSPEIEEAIPDSGAPIPPEYRGRHAALCRLELGALARPFCSDAVSYFEARDDAVAAGFVLSKLADLPDAETPQVLDHLERLDEIVEHRDFDNAHYNWRMATLRHRCAASTTHDIGRAPARCQQLVDAYQQIPENDFDMALSQALIDDLVVLAESTRQNEFYARALGTLDLAATLALAGDEPHWEAYVDALERSGDIHVDDRDAPMAAASIFRAGLRNTKDRDDIDHRLATDLQYRYLEALNAAEEWPLLSRESSRLHTDSIRRAHRQRASEAALFNALANIELGDHHDACSSVASAGELEFEEARRGVRQQVIDRFDDTELDLERCRSARDSI